MKCTSMIRLVGGASFALAFAAAAGAATYKTIDPPGSVFTRPTSITDDGVITGFYGTDLFAFHGFVRNADGTYATFDPDHSQSTGPRGIDGKGRIFGSYSWNDRGHSRGFMRNSDGAITSFTVQGSDFTEVTAMDPEGGLTGTYKNRAGRSYAFLRSPKGKFETFKLPHSVWTIGYGINNAGVIAGGYTTFDDLPHQRSHSFFRTPDGSITSFDPPAAKISIPVAINAAGVITGWFDSALSADTKFERHTLCFVRHADGTFTTFRPNASSVETKPWAINAAGTIVGTYETTDLITHAFLRETDGTILNIDHPDSKRDTVPMAIRDDGVIAGNFDGKDGVTHGFIRTP
ncbi:MAG: hypothetical protein JO056_13910 [Alphaproteobacteria bacterium]|nr:hypothetical protein [Alphaproteobacteria bacterium]